MNAAQLTIAVTALEERVQLHLKQSGELFEGRNKDMEARHQLRLDLEKEIVAIKKDIEELKKNKDLWGNRAFTILVCFVSSILGGLITYYVKKA